MQFAVPLAALPRTSVRAYEGRIPAVLVMMRKYLIKHGGLDVVGIFRLAPEKDECDQVKKEINSGCFEGCRDVNVMSNLIKVWFREMPPNLLDAVEQEQIVKITKSTMDKVLPAIETFPEPNRSILLWLLDLMSDVVKNSEVNKMSAENMAIVMSPNLFSVNTENPMFAMEWTQKVALFTTMALKARLRYTHGYEV